MRKGEYAIVSMIAIGVPVAAWSLWRSGAHGWEWLVAVPLALVAAAAACVVALVVWAVIFSAGYAAGERESKVAAQPVVKGADRTNRTHRTDSVVQSSFAAERPETFLQRKAREAEARIIARKASKN